jgi:hypothetical protein
MAPVEFRRGGDGDGGVRVDGNCAGDHEKEMCENKNIAVGILCGGIVLGICWIVAASMS